MEGFLIFIVIIYLSQWWSNPDEREKLFFGPPTDDTVSTDPDDIHGPVDVAVSIDEQATWEWIALYRKPEQRLAALNI